MILQTWELLPFRLNPELHWPNDLADTGCLNLRVRHDSDVPSNFQSDRPLAIRVYVFPEAKLGRGLRDGKPETI